MAGTTHPGAHTGAPDRDATASGPPTTVKRRPPAAIVAAPPPADTAPIVEAPERAVAGKPLKLSGSGFKAASKVEIVLDTKEPEVVGSVVTKSDGSFKAFVAVPARAPEKDKIRVVGTSAAGKKTQLAKVVLVVAEGDAAATGSAGLARPVLLTLAGVIPLVTWLVLEFLGWRNRRLDKKPG